MRRRLLEWLVLSGSLIQPCIASGTELVEMDVQEKWSAVFGNQELRLHLEIQSEEAMAGRLAWQLTMQDRVVERRESAVEFRPGETVGMQCPVAIPAVKEGVVLRAEFRAELISASGQPLGATEKLLWIFSKDPFADRQVWLTELPIRLFDPVGQTAETLEGATIPFVRVQNPDALGELTDGVLCVGEGISFHEYKGLAEALFQAAAKGAQVICLAPAEGTMTLPGLEPIGQPFPSELHFRHAGIITELDKRLDAESWPPEGRLAPTVMTVRNGPDHVTGEFSQIGEGWPWAQIAYAGGGGFRFCGFPVVAEWNNSPTPRYLFLRMLEKTRTRKETEP